MYYIYHIKGIKIGCSINPKKRVKAQGYTDYEILESYTDYKIAAKREIELQKEYEYKLDFMEYDVEQYREMGKIGGSSNHKRTFGNATIEQRRKWALKASKTPKIGNRVKILQYDKQGNFIKEWESVTAAADYIGCKHSNISAVLSGREKSCRGFVWKYAD